MTPKPDNLKNLLNRAMDGRLDDFSADEIAALERHLNDDASDAARFAAAAPRRDELALAVSLPREREWAAVWNAVESAGATGREAQVAPAAAVIRAFPWFRGMTAAAACLALVLVWRFSPSSSTAAAPAGWELQLSPENHILELSMSASAPPTVHYSDDGVAIIAYDDSPAAPEGASDDDEAGSNLPAPRDTRDRLAR